MSVIDESPEFNIDSDTAYFLEWTVEKYHAETDWKEVRSEFEKTATLVRSLVEACVEARTLGSSEFKAICHAANDHLTQTTLQGYIREFDVDTETKEALVNSVPPSFGIVGGPTMNIEVTTAEAEEQLLTAFETLVDGSSSKDQLLAAVDEIAAAETEGVKAGRLTPVLCLLWPEVFPINNGRTRTVLSQFFGIAVTDSLDDYRQEISGYAAVREHFGFRTHFRDLDRFCHWALEGDGSAVAEWVEKNNIADRTVWQINAGVSDRGEPEKLWPLWKEHGICSIGWDAVDLSALSDDELEEQASQWDGSAVADYYRRFSREMEPGELIIAKDGYDILGIGVTKRGGYQYGDSFIKTETGVHHPHVWPVEWIVAPESPQNTSDWELATNLQSRTTLLRTRAFEQIRLELTRKQPALLSDLSELESVVADPPTASFQYLSTHDASYYWVNQNNRAEIEGEYLDASVDEVWHHDLTVLDVGDVVFHYSDGDLIGESTVETEAQVVETDDGKQYRVAVDFSPYDPPVTLEAVREYLNREEVRAEKYYPLDKNGKVQQSYLSQFTETAAEYLRDNVERRYFWVNSETTDWYQSGGQQFYTATNSAGRKRQNYEAFKRASTGDKVLVYRISPVKQVVGEARVVTGLDETSDEERSDDGITLEWERSIDGPQWADIKRDQELLESNFVKSDNSFYITELTSSEYDRIVHLDPPTLYGEYSEGLSVPDAELTVRKGSLYFEDEEWSRIRSRVTQALAAGNHVLLFGPPGTGKTKLARNVCEETVGDEQFELVTASADWSTFDTVGGYQTTADNELAFQPGVVLDRFQRDEEGTPANEWLIIDELNRADIDKAFGSLFSALTGESVTLPFDGSEGDPIEILDASRTEEEVTPDKFYIPEDWRMLATMNTLDKTSLYEMSYAFMRRWAFIPVGIPDFPEEGEDDSAALADLVKNYVAAWNNGETPEGETVYETIGQIWRAINGVRAIGPAIVEDVYEHVATTPADSDPDYVSPLIMYVFPQLEGLRRDELEQVLRDLDTIVSADTDELWAVARDFFQVDVRRESE